MTEADLQQWLAFSREFCESFADQLGAYVDMLEIKHRLQANVRPAVRKQLEKELKEKAKEFEHICKWQDINYLGLVGMRKQLQQ